MIPAPDTLDTQLARLLHAQGRLPLEALTRELQTVRAERAVRPEASLAGRLVQAGLLPPDEAETCLRELDAWLGSSSPGAPPPAPTLALNDEQAASGETAGWRPGAQIGPYLIEEKIGQGGMGIVFKAHHQHSGELVAIKALSLEAEQELQLRFEREVEAQSRADHHPNVVRVHDSGQACGYRYLVMDLAPGGDLHQRLRAGPLPQREAAELLLSLAKGLAHVHACGLLHRDLKPANVLFASDGTPMLVDFGLAGMRSGRSGLTRTGDMLGTPNYMSREQALGEVSQVDERTDVYALGAILYACLTGGPPFVSRTVIEVLSAVIQDPPPPPHLLVPKLDRDLEAICLQALSKERKDRPQSARALADLLAEWLVSTSRPARRGPLPLIAAGLGALALLGVAGVFALQASPLVPTSTLAPASTPDPNPLVWSPALRQRFQLRLSIAAASTITYMGTSGDGDVTGATRYAAWIQTAGEVTEESSEKLRIAFQVTATESELSHFDPRRGNDRVVGALKAWVGRRFEVEFERGSGLPVKVPLSELSLLSDDEPEETQIFKAMRQDDFLLRWLDPAFHHLPRPQRRPPRTWRLKSDPLVSITDVFKHQVPRTALLMGEIVVKWRGGVDQLRLDPASREAEAIEREGEVIGVRWGVRVPEGGLLPDPEQPGRLCRGGCRVEGGWPRAGWAEETILAEFAEAETNHPLLLVRTRVRREAELSLLPPP